MACGKVELWNEPVRGGYPGWAFFAQSGAERIRSGVAAAMPRPPIHHLAGGRPIDGGEGFSVFELPASEWLLSSAGVFMGGVLAFAADAPLGGAIMSVLPAGAYTTTSELSLNFLRPATPASGSIVARARLIQAGSRIGLSEVVVEDARGRMLAHGTTRCFVLRVDLPDVLPHEPPVVHPTYDTPDPWQRPVVGAVLSQDVFDSMDGLTVARAALAGELPPPPFSHLFGTRLTDVGDGHASMAMVASEWLHSPARNVYGGCTAVLADAAMNMAYMTTLPKRASYATLDLHLNYLRPAFGDGTDLTARAEVVHRGRRFAVARAEIVNAEGKPVVIATSSAMLLPDRRWDVMRPVVAADEAESD